MPDIYLLSDELVVGDVWLIDPTVVPSGGGTPQNVSITGMTSRAQFGTPSFNLTVNITGLTTRASFGALASVNQTFNITGLTSRAAFGTPSVNPGNVNVPITGLTSRFAAGTIGLNQSFNVGGLTSQVSIPTPSVTTPDPGGGGFVPQSDRRHLTTTKQR